jgi:hypothetical protein
MDCWMFGWIGFGLVLERNLVNDVGWDYGLDSWWNLKFVLICNIFMGFDRNWLMRLVYILLLVIEFNCWIVVWICVECLMLIENSVKVWLVSCGGHVWREWILWVFLMGFKYGLWNDNRMMLDLWLGSYSVVLLI